MNLKKIAEGIKRIASRKKTVAVIVQCRLSSTRLPRKALLPLGGKTVLEWTLAAMKKVKASKYYLASDEESKAELESVARKCGWDFFAGSQSDVLARFCGVIRLSKADIVVRATADNPFLFYEAAQDLLDEFTGREESFSADYMTYSGLPHGSGVEVFNAHSLLKAAEETDSPYDHEHVGPALYNHSQRYECVFAKPAPQYRRPEFRTTIDTEADYRRALRIVKEISGEEAVSAPYAAHAVLAALEKPSVSNPVLLIPSVKKNGGTGHLRRCLDLAVKNNWDIFLPDSCGLTQCSVLTDSALKNGLSSFQIVKSLSGLSSYSLAVTDLFSTEPSFAQELAAAVPVAALDEGSRETGYADYLADVLPPARKNRRVNCADPSFIPMPEKRRSSPRQNEAVHSAIVSVGGEDPSGLSFAAALALAQNGLSVTAVVSSEESAESLRQKIPENAKKNIRVCGPVENLREHLYKYDLAVTHYGFTAFEALGAGCAVILLGTTPLHAELSRAYGFKCLLPNKITAKSFRKLLSEPEQLHIPLKKETDVSLADFLRRLSMGSRLDCPVCRKNSGYKDKIVARTKERTFRRCRSCGMIYMAWNSSGSRTEYNRAYFYEDYERQYGKTYLEDFDAIKAACVRRISIIDFLYRISGRNMRNPAVPSVLDIGCAMGPFLAAANDSGWQSFGTDISVDAVEYVQKELNIPAACAQFPDFDPACEFGIEKFDAVTMWYVIEHFQDLDSALKKVSSLVKDGGIFAFSTPSASGISARSRAQEFFERSPSDHFTVWETDRARPVLRKYGLEIVRIVSTGIHPERFPIVRKMKWKEQSLAASFVRIAGKKLRLGDTVEIYCRKIKS
ncbi:MAG: methyltransferase domain-containing protein [Treponema sp.]|nr:methyltransferase domain-containing protein [Treponema sp.]